MRLIVYAFHWVSRQSVDVLLPFKNIALKIGEKRAYLLLVIAVALFISGLGRFMIFLSGFLHPHFGLMVLLYFTGTTFTMRYFGDTAYGIFERLGQNNLAVAQKELSETIGCNTEGMNASEMVRATVLMVAGNSVYGIVAPMMYLFVGGVHLAMAYQAIHTLHVILGQKKEWGWGARLYDGLNFIPARITAILIVLCATCLWGTGSKAFRIFLRNGFQYHSPSGQLEGVVMAGAIGMTLRAPFIDVDVLPLFPLHDEKIDEAQPHHIMDAIKAMGVVACVMLIICMMI